MMYEWPIFWCLTQYNKCKATAQASAALFHSKGQEASIVCSLIPYLVIYKFFPNSRIAVEAVGLSWSAKGVEASGKLAVIL